MDSISQMDMSECPSIHLSQNLFARLLVQVGWWFAIRIAWPNVFYPSPDHIVQKVIRLHCPMQLLIDNSVSAGGIWRNILMGSRAERNIDLERLRV
jgi:ABC-type nitrate/sulfonate/bicarbonate transport system permease component